MIIITPQHELWAYFLRTCYQYIQENWPKAVANQDMTEFLTEYDSLLKRRFQEGKRFFAIHLDQDGDYCGLSISYIKDTTFYIAEFYVYSSYRRSGMGAAMYDELIEWARAQGALKIYIEVDRQLSIANSFWLSRGLILDDSGERNIYRGNIN